MFKGSPILRPALLTIGKLLSLDNITLANLSILKTNKARAVRFSTFEAACRELECQPGDLLEYVPDGGSAGVGTVK
jgi:putative transcriptional regulator